MSNFAAGDQAGKLTTLQWLSVSSSYLVRVVESVIELQSAGWLSHNKKIKKCVDSKRFILRYSKI
jgi:hypothetical protein